MRLYPIGSTFTSASGDRWRLTRPNGAHVCHFCRRTFIRRAAFWTSTKKHAGATRYTRVCQFCQESIGIPNAIGATDPTTPPARKEART